MEFEADKLVRKTKFEGSDVVIVTPGLSLYLYSDVPLVDLAPSIADAIEAYQAFVPKDALQNYVAGDAGVKKLSPKTVAGDLKQLRKLPKKYYEFHYGRELDQTLGTYALRFNGTSLSESDLWPLETNLLWMHFPLNFLDLVKPEAFLKFVTEMADRVPFCAGNAGLAFQHPRPYAKEAYKVVGEMMPRYLGFDPSYEHSRYVMKGKTTTAHWMNLLGPAVTKKLGGADKIRATLPKEVQVQPLKKGLLIQGAPRPPVGDVNRGAKDLGWLPEVARLLKPTRFEITGFRSNAVDPAKWLARFDDLKSPGKQPPP